MNKQSLYIWHVFSAAIRSFNYMQWTGGTYSRPTVPYNQGDYIGQASSTCQCIAMVASDENLIF